MEKNAWMEGFIFTDCIHFRRTAPNFNLTHKRMHTDPLKRFMPKTEKKSLALPLSVSLSIRNNKMISFLAVAHCLRCPQKIRLESPNIVPYIDYNAEKGKNITAFEWWWLFCLCSCCECLVNAWVLFFWLLLSFPPPSLYVFLSPSLYCCTFFSVSSNPSSCIGFLQLLFLSSFRPITLNSKKYGREIIFQKLSHAMHKNSCVVSTKCKHFKTYAFVCAV